MMAGSKNSRVTTRLFGGGVIIAIISVTTLFLDFAPTSAQRAANSCVDCHATLPDERLSKPAQLFETDIHKDRGLSCTDCHGGDATKADMKAAKTVAAGYIGKPRPIEIPAFCGKCHSDAALMKKFNPGLRVDQVQEYYTSVHGQRLRMGDQNVATCASCHGIHGIRPPNDPGSTVFALNVAETCSQCHSDAARMQPYGIPTDQFAKYKTSAHANALYEKRDLSAPSCNDCHGNHGAVPPGLDNIALVCGSCHGRQAELFRQSPHKQPFDAQKVGECLRCHSNHAVLSPTDAMVGTGEGSTCTACHTGDKGYAAAHRMGTGIAKLDHDIAAANKVLDDAERAGMEVSKAKFELKEATDALTQARVLVHGVSADEVQQAIDPGLSVAERAFRAGEAAFAELSFRRMGLGISLFFILFLAGLIYLKVRQIEGKYPFADPTKG